MEQITPNSEFFRIEADISYKNAVLLNELRETTSVSLNEHIRRATGTYVFAVARYTEGGEVHGQTEEGTEILPLFYAVDDEDLYRPSVRLSVNLNKETAHALEELGINGVNKDTAIMDNVINYYSHALRLSKDGQKLIVVYADGTMAELELMGDE